MTYDTAADVPIQSTIACDLRRSGFTEAQAMALAQVVEASASGAVDRLGRDLARWHIHLALYLLIQLGIVLLGVLMIQATRDPILPPRAGRGGPSDACMGGDAPAASAAWALERAGLFADGA